ncbi:MAG: hypothetical protein NC905_04635 [Candidatus Omnitrophica bacterium]|nr:hypothetical protein [Candidatus Omnitrophota bacterium]
MLTKDRIEYKLLGMGKFKKERILWEVVDPLKRKVKLTAGSYRHIKECHPKEAILTEKIKETIKLPISIWEDKNIKEDKKVWYYFNEIESEELNLIGIEKPYIIVIVKRIENEFRIVSWYVYHTIGKKGATEIWKKEKEEKKE